MKKGQGTTTKSHDKDGTPATGLDQRNKRQGPVTRSTDKDVSTDMELELTDKKNIPQLERKIQSKDRELQQLKRKLHSKDRELQEAKKELQKRDDRISHLEKELQNCKHFIDQQQEKERKRLKAEQRERERIERERREREEQERRERERLHPFFAQDKVSSWPNFESLREFGIYWANITDQVFQGRNIHTCFYIVNHTARLETVNLNRQKLDELRGSFPNVRFILVALTPGTGASALPAAKHLSTGEEVVTMWYRNNMFNHEDNMSSYEKIKKIIQEIPKY